MSHSDYAPGRFVMAGLPGLELDGRTEELVARFGLANFILFRRNIESPAQLAGLCAALTRCCGEHGLGQPLIAIDQEGGTVSRLPPPFSQFGDAREIEGADDPLAAARRYARTCGQELRQVGINMNLAPVLDVCPGRDGAWFMARRCLGSDPRAVARLGAAIVEELQRTGVAACAKHFPGLGSARLDPHEVAFAIDKEEKDLLREDLLPFAAAIEVGVAAVMTSHTVYAAFDGQRPATLSKEVCTKLLRNKLGFSGVLITDDLEMGAIAGQIPVPQAAVRAFAAGADLLLICENQEHVAATCRLLAENRQTGKVPEERFQAAGARLAALQRRIGRKVL